MIIFHRRCDNSVMFSFQADIGLSIGTQGLLGSTVESRISSPVNLSRNNACNIPFKITNYFICNLFFHHSKWRPACSHTPQTKGINCQYGCSIWWVDVGMPSGVLNPRPKVFIIGGDGTQLGASVI
ncbi:hypothetical protein MKX01_002522 [Papaver californicum]|nr:hypothetical protein MKX01_002522 [Papaver californicum]